MLEVKYSTDHDALSPVKVTKSDLGVEFSEGKILLDREAGCVVEARGRTRIKGSMNFSAMGQDLPGELDLTLDNQEELLSAAR